MDEYEMYEKECKKIRKVNKKLLTEFDLFLIGAGLTQKTADKHYGNIAFYIDHYLLYEEAIKAQDGSGLIGGFLGHWFIRKAMWSNQAEIKSNTVSLKKFYTFMLEKGLIENAQLVGLKRTIKEELPDWLASMKRYDNMSYD